MALDDRPAAAVHYCYGDACRCQSRVRTPSDQPPHGSPHSPLRTDRRSQRKSSPRGGYSALTAGESLLRVPSSGTYDIKVHVAITIITTMTLRMMTHIPGVNSIKAHTGWKHDHCCDRRLRADMTEAGRRLFVWKFPPSHRARSDLPAKAIRSSLGSQLTATSLPAASLNSCRILWGT